MLVSAAIFGLGAGTIVAMMRLNAYAAGAVSAALLLAGVYGWAVAGEIHLVESIVAILALQASWFLITRRFN